MAPLTYETFCWAEKLTAKAKMKDRQASDRSLNIFKKLLPYCNGAMVTFKRTIRKPFFYRLSPNLTAIFLAEFC